MAPRCRWSLYWEGPLSTCPKTRSSSKWQLPKRALNEKIQQMQNEQEDSVHLEENESVAKSLVDYVEPAGFPSNHDTVGIGDIAKSVKSAVEKRVEIKFKIAERSSRSTITAKVTNPVTGEIILSPNDSEKSLSTDEARFDSLINSLSIALNWVMANTDLRRAHVLSLAA